MPIKHHMGTEELQERISEASAELAGAEQALLTALEALPTVLRSEKRIISATLLEALEKVAAAKGNLSGILAERRQGGDSPPPEREPPQRS
jgi:hypothetical protein